MKVCPVCLRCYEDAAFSCREDANDSLTAARPGSCEAIDGYRLESLIEINEISETYRAINLASNQACLIKITAANLLISDKFQARFLGEAQAAARVDHPHVARSFESGVLPDGSFYAVGEAIIGETLRARLDAGGALTEMAAVSIARQAAEGLEALHEIGIAHRSIGPENIILTADAENELLVKIQNIDFGGARQQLINSGEFDAEFICSDLKYFSPEQCAGESNIDSLTDVYSLGIVLYEMLAGQPPFTAPDAAGIIDKQINEPAPPIKILKFNIRALLTHTLTLALQKPKIARLKSANAFARQLRNIEQLTLNLLPLTPAAKLGNKKTIMPVNRHVSQAPTVSTLPAPQEPAFAAPVIEKEPVTAAILTKEETVAPAKIVNSDQPKRREAAPIAKPVLVEWEQPEDIPTESETAQILGEDFNKKKALSLEAISADEDIFINHEPKLKPKSDEKVRTVQAKPVARRSYNFEDFRQRVYIPHRTGFISTGAALLLLILAGAFINWRVQSPNKQPVNVSSQFSTGKSAVIPGEPEAPKDITASAAKPEGSTAGDEAAVMEMPDLPDSKTFVVRANRVTTPEKPQLATMKQGGQNLAVKEPAGSKPELKREAVALKGNSSGKPSQVQNAFPDIKIIIGKSPPNSSKPNSAKSGGAKADVFTRQRIVQKSKP